MKEEGKVSSKKELLRDIDNLQKRMNNYDWDYRMTRFEDKIQHEKETLSHILKQIKLSD